MSRRLLSLSPTINILRSRHIASSSVAMTRPDPKAWLKERLEALYTQDSTRGSIVDADIEKTFVPKERAKISKNGEDVSLEKYKEDFRQTRVAKATVTVAELQEDEDTARALENDEDTKSITVKGSFSVSRWLHIRFRGAAQEEKRISNFEAQLEPSSPDSADFRIAHLKESVRIEKPHMHVSPIAHLQGSNPQD